MNSLHSVPIVQFSYKRINELMMNQ